MKNNIYRNSKVTLNEDNFLKGLTLFKDLKKYSEIISYLKESNKTFSIVLLSRPLKNVTKKIEKRKTDLLFRLSIPNFTLLILQETSSIEAETYLKKIIKNTYDLKNYGLIYENKNENENLNDVYIKIIESALYFDRVDKWLGSNIIII